MGWASPQQPRIRHRRRPDAVPRPGQEWGEGGMSPGRTRLGVTADHRPTASWIPWQRNEQHEREIPPGKENIFEGFLPHLWFHAHGFFADSRRTFWKGWDGRALSLPHSQSGRAARAGQAGGSWAAQFPASGKLTPDSSCSKKRSRGNSFYDSSSLTFQVSSGSE